MKTEVLSYTERMVKKGEEKGMKKGKIETIRNMLRKNMNIELICEIMNVSSEYVESIRSEIEQN